MKLILASVLNDVVINTLKHLPKPLKDCKVVCITTAANVYAPEKRSWQDDEMNAVRNAGATLETFDIAGKTPQEVAQKLDMADAVYVTGGNTYYLLEHMQKCEFKTPLMALLARGGIYIGASAGAVVTCPRIDFIGDMDNPQLATLSSYQGLNLVPYLIMPHTDHPKFAETAQTLMHAISAPEIVLGLTDTQALLVNANVFEIVQA